MNGDPTLGAIPSSLFAGRYQLTGTIGSGGMGSVDRGYDTVLRREVAIKRLLPGNGSPIRDQRLLLEARAVAQLNHPNVVAVHDVGEVGAIRFIVMELVEGGSLAERLDAAPGSRLPLPQALDWLEIIADALDAAHRAGLVHRDIKPDNVLLTRDGRVKIADFGVVKDLDHRVVTNASAEAALTRAGHIVGTPRYMSPEQLRGEPIDGRTDQYAWGLLAYQLLAGIHPYNAGPNTVSLQHIADGLFVVPPFQTRAPGVSRELEAVVLRALSADREQRFPSMRDARAALSAARQPRAQVNPPAPVVVHPPQGPLAATLASAQHTSYLPPPAPSSRPASTAPPAQLVSWMPPQHIAPPPMTPRYGAPPPPRGSEMGALKIAFAIVAAVLLVGIVGTAIALLAMTMSNDTPEGQPQATKSRVEKLERRVGDRAKSPSLDSAVACDIAQIHALRYGYDGRAGSTLRSFTCGELDQSVTDARLSNLRFRSDDGDASYDVCVTFKYTRSSSGSDAQWYAMQFLRDGRCQPL